jgi:hypothetical protein
VTKTPKTLWLVLSALLALVGLLWILQGSGVLSGGSMSGSRTWLVIGVICLVVGLGWFVSQLLARRRPQA